MMTSLFRLCIYYSFNKQVCFHWKHLHDYIYLYIYILLKTFNTILIFAVFQTQVKLSVKANGTSIHKMFHIVLISKGTTCY